MIISTVWMAAAAKVCCILPRELRLWKRVPKCGCNSCEVCRTSGYLENKCMPLYTFLIDIKYIKVLAKLYQGPVLPCRAESWPKVLFINFSINYFYCFRSCLGEIRPFVNLLPRLPLHWTTIATIRASDTTTSPLIVAAIVKGIFRLSSGGDIQIG